MRYRNLIWDFDGTLFDSYPHSEVIFRDFLRRERHLETDLETLDRLFRQTLEVAFEYYHFDEEEIRAYLKEEADMFREPRAVPFPDAERTLRGVIAGGGRNYLFTHRTVLAVAYLSSSGLWKYFSGSVTREQGFPRKPAPDGIAYMLARYRLKPEETIMIGDREIDPMSGQNAGIAGCLVTCDPILRDSSSAFFKATDLKDVCRQLDIPQAP